MKPNIIYLQKQSLRFSVTAYFLALSSKQLPNKNEQDLIPSSREAQTSKVLLNQFNEFSYIKFYIEAL